MARTFQSILSENTPDNSLNDRYLEMSKVVKNDYLILFNARSGSTWLTNILSGVLGLPEEYINPEFIREVSNAVGATDQTKYLNGLRGKTNTNGIFGIEATSEHIEIFGEELFFSIFDKLTVFHLWRENLVAQAISLFRAVETGYFHSSNGDLPNDPVYDGDKILQWFRYLARVENMNMELISRRRLIPINLTYESIILDEANTIAKFHDALGIPFPSKINNAVVRSEKLASTWNRECELNFRSEFGDEVRVISENRLTRLIKL